MKSGKALQGHVTGLVRALPGSKMAAVDLYGGPTLFSPLQLALAHHPNPTFCGLACVKSLRPPSIMRLLPIQTCNVLVWIPGALQDPAS